MTAVLYLAGSMLVAAAAVTVVRLLRGPSVLDRVVAVDLLLATALCGLGVWVAASRDSSIVTLLVVFALLGFVGSVAVARTLGRRGSWAACRPASRSRRTSWPRPCCSPARR